MTIAKLLADYAQGVTSPREVVFEALRGIEAGDPAIWISVCSREQLEGFLRRLEGESPETLPLFGVPFGIKDNIDLAGLPTTAACPAWKQFPEESAFAVGKLIEAGAIPMGKTNLDQFATGLVGVRSPYGVPQNPFHEDYIPGGSSSGSAVAVARGQVAFALGTDTAGSGRVPASLNGLVGLKGSRGAISCRGVVPACRTLDCVSIFAQTCADVERVWKVASVYDREDAYARPPGDPLAFSSKEFRFGVPSAEQLEFFGSQEAAELFRQAVARLQSLGGKAVPLDLGPFLEAARLLYEGPWVAERYAVIEELLHSSPDEVLAVTRQIISGGGEAKVVEAFRAQYRLQELRRMAEDGLSEMDFFVTPTVGRAFTLHELEAEPVQRNSDLGYYTNYLNLLDLLGLAVPVGRGEDGMPWGVTLVAQPFSERALLEVGARFCAEEEDREADLPEGHVELLVCGAHMRGLDLNSQLTDRGAWFLRETRTAPAYRFYKLPGGPPERPGLIRVEKGGRAIQVELWAMPLKRLGDFLAEIPSPLGLGRVELAEGREVLGFLCENWIVSKAQDVTIMGSWRKLIKK
ncbi:MAG: allophanate hydrolase [Verrucomicrobiota bacterium]